MQAKREWGAGRIAFLARRDAIRAALEAGRTLTAIYNEHRAGLGIGYVQFTRYVQFYLRAARHSAARPEPGRNPPARTNPPKAKGFQFDPTAVDRKHLV